MWIHDREELAMIRRFRKKRYQESSRTSSPQNPAVGLALSLRELPKWTMQNLPHAFTTIGQVINVVDVILFGFMDFDGERRRLNPREISVLLMVTAVRLKLLNRKIVGTLDADNLAELLGYRPRAMRDALRGLEDLGLIVIDRERGRIMRVWLAHRLMDLPDRPRPEDRELRIPLGRSNSERRALMRQKNAALLSKRAELDDNPLPPCEPAAAAPPGPSPFTPPTATAEETLRSGPAAPAPLVELDAPRPLTDGPPARRHPDTRHKRPRQQGADDRSAARGVAGFWRSCLELVGMGGHGPPS